jgi:hypothetical protein
MSDETLLSLTVSGSGINSSAVVDAELLPLPDNLEDCGEAVKELRLGQLKVAMIVNWHIGRILCHVNDTVLPEIAEEERRRKEKNPTVWKNRDAIFREFCDGLGISRGTSQESIQFYRRFTGEEVVQQLVEAGMLWKTSLTLAKLTDDKQVSKLVDKVKSGKLTQPEVVEEVAKLNKTSKSGGKKGKADPNAPGRLRVDRFTHGLNSYFTTILLRTRSLCADLGPVFDIANDEERTDQDVFDEAVAQAGEVSSKIASLRTELEKIEKFCTSITESESA